MCTMLTNGNAKNCTCKFAHLCKRRDKIESAKSKFVASLTSVHIDTNTLRAQVAPAYPVNFRGENYFLKERQS